MSKEQTPIKDLEFYKSNAEEDYMNTPISVLRYITELENNTQAEVLEALENEFTNYENNNPNKGHIEYYETEVKPKYEL